MKKTSLILAASAVLTLTSPGALIAYWNFNELSITSASAPGSGGVPTEIAADQGSGTVGLTGWEGTVASFKGTTSNALGGDPDGASLSLVAGGSSPGPYPGNGSSITISFSTTDYEDIELSYATQRTSTGFTSQAWAYSFDGITFTSIETLEGLPTSFTKKTIDLSGISEVNDKGEIYLRLTLDGATGNSGNNRIDNLQITGTLIPEPATTLSASLALLALLRRRR